MVNMAENETILASSDHWDIVKPYKKIVELRFYCSACHHRVVLRSPRGSSNWYHYYFDKESRQLISRVQCPCGCMVPNGPDFNERAIAYKKLEMLRR